MAEVHILGLWWIWLLTGPFYLILDVLLRWWIVPWILQKFYQSNYYQNNIKEKHQKHDNYYQYDLALLTERIISILSAIFSSICGALVCLETFNDILHARSSILLPVAYILEWYIIHDSCTFFITYRQSQLKLSQMPILKVIPRFIINRSATVVHHMMIIIFGIVVMHPIARNGKGDFFIGYFFAMELTTPFVSLHFVVKRLDLTDNMLYRVNGVLLFLFYLIVRTVLLPFLYVLYAIQYHHGNIVMAITSMRWICHLFMTIWFMLNIYWFSGVLRLLTEGAKNFLSVKTN